MKRGVTIPLGLVIAVLIGLYVSGHFDRPLYSIGLNITECARNGLGATFCGKELDEYRARTEQVKESIAHTQESAEASERTTEEHLKAAETARSDEEMRSLAAKLEREERIMKAEPETSVAYNLAKGEYEFNRARLQQLAADNER